MSKKSGVDSADKRLPVLPPSRETSKPWIRTRDRCRPSDRSGKWLLFLASYEVDAAWRKIRRATNAGVLGCAAKVATESNLDKDGRHTVCIYTGDWADTDDVERVLSGLRDLGGEGWIRYKRDADTEAGIYGQGAATFVSGPGSRSFATRRTEPLPPEGAGPGELRLLPEPVPEPLWRLSAHGLLSRPRWRKMRRATLDAAGDCCSICGAPSTGLMGLVCDEVWSYDEETGVAALAGLRSICYPCNWAKHIGIAGTEGHGRQSQEQLALVNGIDLAEAEMLQARAWEDYDRRSDRSWTMAVAPELLAAWPQLDRLVGCQGSPGDGWRKVSEGEFASASELRQVFGIGAEYVLALADAGVSSLEELLTCEPETVVAVCGDRGFNVSEGMVERWKRHAEALLKKRPVVFGDVSAFSETSFIALDLEYDPHVWLMGAGVLREGAVEHHQFWAADVSEEEEALLQLLDLLEQHRDLKVLTWAGNGADVPRLREAGARHGLEDRVEAVVDRHSDLFVAALRSVRLPMSGLDLKGVASHFRIPGGGGDGLWAVIQFGRYRETTSVTERDQIREELMAYNKSDLDMLVGVAGAFRSLVTK